MFPNLLALDAPLIAVGLTQLVLKEQGAPTPHAAMWVMFVAVWGVYLTDRLVDVMRSSAHPLRNRDGQVVDRSVKGRALDFRRPRVHTRGYTTATPTRSRDRKGVDRSHASCQQQHSAPNTARHHFALKHRGALLYLTTATWLSVAWLSFNISRSFLITGCLVGGSVLSFLLLCRWTHSFRINTGNLTHLPLKELAMAFGFAVGVMLLPNHSDPPLQRYAIWFIGVFGLAFSNLLLTAQLETKINLESDAQAYRAPSHLSRLFWMSLSAACCATPALALGLSLSTAWFCLTGIASVASSCLKTPEHFPPAAPWHLDFCLHSVWLILLF